VAASASTFAAQLFPPATLTYLDTATYGLPPRATTDALQAALADWARGESDWQQAERDADHARTLFAKLINTTADHLALLPSASAAASTVAGTLTQGEIVIAHDDHPSVTLPLLNIAQRRDVHIRQATFRQVADTIDENTSLVACSHVHYATGEIADVRAIVEAAAQVGAATYLDVTQSAGVLPVDPTTIGIDYVGCAAYKWLCCPRGTAFLYVSPKQLGTITALAPSRRATSTPLKIVPLANVTFAGTASKLDFSLAWLPWIGARHSLQAILSINQQARQTRSIGLASRLADLLELPCPSSAICPVPVKDIAHARLVLAAAHITTSVRGDTIRVSPHLYNTDEDIDRVAVVLKPLLSKRLTG
jgi:selenocysteine lyase/cysteine desulfurase